MSLEEQRQARIDKLQRLRELEVNPYPYSFDRSHSLSELLAGPEAFAESEEEVSVAGRIRALRDHGKSIFADIEDGSGRFQVFVRKAQVGERAFEVVKLLELGDWVGVGGTVFKTRTEQWTVGVRSIQVLSKALRPLPEKWHGLKSVETRYRQRYVDLIMNPEVREVFRTRSRIVDIIREVFDAIGGLEVETPTLQPLYGGASARPFETHHNALGCTFYLRIADELYLKRLIVGGFECVYEICKDFRNEGMSRVHNPEFTMAEIYWAYRDYTDMMDLTERLVVTLAERLKGGYTFEYQGIEVDLTPPLERVPMVELVRRHTGIDAAALDQEGLRQAAREWVRALAEAPEQEASRDSLVKLAAELGGWSWGDLVAELFELAVEPQLTAPTFVTDFPKEISPLAKEHRDDPRLTERFELFAAGKELANAFSELNDPLDQRSRFTAEEAKREGGDEEAQTVDEDYLRALEFGMPPTGGLGIGVDRLTMLFTNQASIQDVILFPHMRPEEF